MDEAAYFYIHDEVGPEEESVLQRFVSNILSRFYFFFTAITCIVTWRLEVAGMISLKELGKKRNLKITHGWKEKKISLSSLQQRRKHREQRWSKHGTWVRGEMTNKHVIITKEVEFLIQPFVVIRVS